MSVSLPQSLICHERNEWLSSLRLPCESPTVNDIAISVLAGSFTLFSCRNARQLNPRKRRRTPSLNSTSHSAKWITPAYRSSIAAITPFVPAYSDATCSDMRSMWEVYISVQVGPSHEEPFPLRTARQANVTLTFGGPAWTVLPGTACHSTDTAMSCQRRRHRDV